MAESAYYLYIEDISEQSLKEEGIYFKIPLGIAQIFRGPKPKQSLECLPLDELVYTTDKSITLTDDFISRDHGAFQYDGRGVSYQDNSRNGTTLSSHGDKRKIQHDVAHLFPDDYILLGGSDEGKEHYKITLLKR